MGAGASGMGGRGAPDGCPIVSGKVGLVPVVESALRKTVFISSRVSRPCGNILALFGLTNILLEGTFRSEASRENNACKDLNLIESKLQ